MKVIVLGASGMAGAGVLCEALNAPELDVVLSIGRHACGVEHAKLRADRFVLESADINRVGA